MRLQPAEFVVSQNLLFLPISHLPYFSPIFFGSTKNQVFINQVLIGLAFGVDARPPAPAPLNLEKKKTDQHLVEPVQRCKKQAA